MTRLLLFAMIRFASMNGTQLLRRSASIALVGLATAMVGCGVDMSGLFDGDAGDDAAPRDAGRDAPSTADRAPDMRIDAMSDVSSSDGRTNDAGRDTTVDPALDPGTGRDAPVDAGGRSDAGLDADAIADAGADALRDASLDGDVARDLGSDPTQDPVAEDAAAEPRPDAASDPTVDAVADAPADTSPDRADAEPPGICLSPCNTFSNISPTITRTVEQGPAPTMTGGTVLDGTYVLAAVVQYNGDTTPYSLSETSIISGNMDTWVSSTNGNPQIRYTTTFTATNNQIAFAFCCPAPGNLTILYTTDGMTLSHIDPANPNRVITYTRQ